ncbi:hypothetical protein [Adhaeribacter aquaticus]|nr:hypothetical protein [Adhaeribacter aquaticus]
MGSVFANPDVVRRRYGYNLNNAIPSLKRDNINAYDLFARSTYQVQVP